LYTEPSAVFSMAQPERPRVLIIGPDLPHLGAAGGIILYRLFQNWPEKALVAAGPALDPSNQHLECRFVQHQPLFYRLETTRFVRFSRLLRAFRLVPIRRFAVESFRPDVIVHVCSSLPYSEVAYAYSRRWEIPLVLIVHDDPEEFNGSFKLVDYVVRQHFRRIYQHAASRLCVSPEMERMLYNRYGVPGKVMFPNRSEAIVPRPLAANACLKEPGKLTLGFAGSLSYGYGPRLLELAPLLRKAGAKVRVYGSDLRSSEHSDVLLNQGRLNTPEEVWVRIKEECDAVLVPYCFPNNGHEALYRTHFPSKLPEYLALGMPVVISGPCYAAGVRWGMRNSEACVVLTEQGGDAWVDALTRLRNDDVLRLRLSEKAVEVGIREFDPLAIRSFFQNHICEVAGWEMMN
jgi:glycosyltransferase involved in cell wall biosynthesis